jgi:hypothetical protein
MISDILKKNKGSVVSRVSSRKECLHENGRMTEAYSNQINIKKAYGVNVA